jgi:hypothetical protein
MIVIIKRIPIRRFALQNQTNVRYLKYPIHQIESMIIYIINQ